MNTKKIISILLIFSLIFTMSVSYAMDFSSTTDEQLKEQFDTIRNELVIRGLKAENKTVLYDNNDIQIYMNDEARLDKRYVFDEFDSLFIPVVVVNNSPYVLAVLVDNCSVNGWTGEGSRDLDDIPAGKKAKGNLIFDIRDADIETINDFTDVEFVITIYDDTAWDVIEETKPITIYSNK